MEKIREIAVMCVGRAVMFASLGIFCIMFSFAFDPVMAFRSGSIMTLSLSAILIVKAMAVTRQNPRRTEVWIYLDEHSRPGDASAKAVFASILREVYARFAQTTFFVACGMFAISLVLGLLGIRSL
jgi:cell division protein FtsW (lipid II flippase)